MTPSQCSNTTTLLSRTKLILIQGCTVQLAAINENTATEDVKLGPERGNHKGPLNQSEELKTLLQKDVTHAYALPITKTTATKIELNIQGQWSINELGERIKKKRLSHDQSFPGLAPEHAINNMVNTDTLAPLI